MPGKTDDGTGLHNAYRCLAYSLETTLAEVKTSYIIKFIEWPTRFDAELQALENQTEKQSRTPLGLAEQNDESVVDVVPFPTIFGSALKPKKAKERKKKKSNRLALWKTPLEQDNDEEECAVIDDEISFKRSVLPDKQSLRKKRLTAGTPKNEKLNLTKVTKKTPPRIPGRPPRRAAFSKASAVLKDNPSGFEKNRSSRRGAGSCKTGPKTSRVIQADISTANISIPSERTDVDSKCPKPNINSRNEIFVPSALESDRNTKQLPIKETPIDHAEKRLIEVSASERLQGKNLMCSTMESTPVCPLNSKLNKLSAMQSESSQSKLKKNDDPHNETLKLSDTPLSNEISSGTASKKRKTDTNTTEVLIQDNQTEFRRSGRLLKRQNSSVTIVYKTPDAKKQHYSPTKVSEPISTESQNLPPNQDSNLASSSKPADKLTVVPEARLSNTRSVLKNSTNKVLNKPGLPLPKLSVNIQKLNTKPKYFSSLKPQSSQLAESQRSIAEERKDSSKDDNAHIHSRSKIAEQVGSSGGILGPKRGFQSQHNHDGTFEQTKHISFSVSLTPTSSGNGPGTSKKKYPVSPLANNVLKSSFKPNIMDCLEEEDSENNFSSQESDVAKSTQMNPNETYNTSRAIAKSNTNLAANATRIIAPTPPPKQVTSVLSTPNPQSSSKWSNTSMTAPKSLFGLNKQSNLVTNAKSFWNTSQVGTPSALKNKQNFKQKAVEAAELKKAALAEKEKRDRERIRLLYQKQEQERLEKKRLNEERALKSKQNVANLMQNQTAAKSGANASASTKISALGGSRLHQHLNNSKHLLPSVAGSSVPVKLTTSEVIRPVANCISAVKQVQLPKPQRKHNYCLMESLLWTGEENEEDLEDSPEHPKNVVPVWAKKRISMLGRQKKRRLVKKILRRQFVKITTIPPLEAIFMSKHPKYDRPRRSTGVWHTVIDAKHNDSLDCSTIV